MTEYLDLEDLLALVDDLEVGPVRDLGLLESAARRPRTMLYGTEAYPTIDEKAAALLDSIVLNHALIDGNKRLGWLAVVVFYGLNAITLDAPDDPAYDLVIEVAAEHSAVTEIAGRLAAWHDGGEQRPTRTALG